jgi:hypothetical protein
LAAQQIYVSEAGDLGARDLGFGNAYQMREGVVD